MTLKRQATIEYDREADAAYILLDSAAYAHGSDLDDSRRIDYAENGRPIGIELLNVSHGVRLDRLPRKEDVRRLLDDQHIPIASASGA